MDGVTDEEYAARLQLEEVSGSVAPAARVVVLCGSCLTQTHRQEFEVATAKVIAERDEQVARRTQRKIEAELRRAGGTVCLSPP